MTQPELNLRDYLRILRKHRYYLIAPTLLLGILTYLLTPTASITYREPKQWHASAARCDECPTDVAAVRRRYVAAFP